MKIFKLTILDYGQDSRIVNRIAGSFLVQSLRTIVQSNHVTPMSHPHVTPHMSHPRFQHVTLTCHTHEPPKSSPKDLVISQRSTLFAVPTAGAKVLPRAYRYNDSALAPPFHRPTRGQHPHEQTKPKKHHRRQPLVRSSGAVCHWMRRYQKARPTTKGSNIGSSGRAHLSSGHDAPSRSAADADDLPDYHAHVWPTCGNGGERRR